MRALGLILAVTAASAATALLGPAPAGAAPSPPIVRPANANRLSDLELGRQLFAGNCASCHGSDGTGVAPGTGPPGTNGIRGAGPSLWGVGARAANFYLMTGYMPLANPNVQPFRSRPLLHPREIRALTSYVASLGGGGGPPIPPAGPSHGSVSRGNELFTTHCAGCHQVVAAGGVVTGATAVPLNQATPQQIREAVRIGPYVMPSFPTTQITDKQLEDIVAYVEYAKSPKDKGGWGIAHLGPFPEGMVAWGIGIVLLVITCVAIGTRVKSS